MGKIYHGPLLAPHTESMHFIDGVDEENTTPLFELDQTGLINPEQPLLQQLEALLDTQQAQQEADKIKANQDALIEEVASHAVAHFFTELEKDYEPVLPHWSKVIQELFKPRPEPERAQEPQKPVMAMNNNWFDWKATVAEKSYSHEITEAIPAIEISPPDYDTDNVQTGTPESLSKSTLEFWNKCIDASFEDRGWSAETTAAAKVLIHSRFRKFDITKILNEELFPTEESIADAHLWLNTTEALPQDERTLQHLLTEVGITDESTLSAAETLLSAQTPIEIMRTAPEHLIGAELAFHGKRDELAKMIRSFGSLEATVTIDSLDDETTDKIIAAALHDIEDKKRAEAIQLKEYFGMVVEQIKEVTKGHAIYANESAMINRAIADGKIAKLFPDDIIGESRRTSFAYPSEIVVVSSTFIDSIMTKNIATELSESTHTHDFNPQNPATCVIEIATQEIKNGQPVLDREGNPKGTYIQMQKLANGEVIETERTSNSDGKIRRLGELPSVGLLNKVKSALTYKAEEMIIEDNDAIEELIAEQLDVNLGKHEATTQTKVRKSKLRTLINSFMQRDKKILKKRIFRKR